MNSYDVNRYNVPIGRSTIRRVFPNNGNKIIRGFEAFELHPGTKTCLISIGEYGHLSNKIARVWYTFDGTTPTPTNGHRMTSRSILELSVEMVLDAKFSNQPGHQNGDFSIFLNQLTN